MRSGDAGLVRRRVLNLNFRTPPPTTTSMTPSAPIQDQFHRTKHAINKLSHQILVHKLNPGLREPLNYPPNQPLSTQSSVSPRTHTDSPTLVATDQLTSAQNLTHPSLQPLQLFTIRLYSLSLSSNSLSLSFAVPGSHREKERVRE